MITTKMSITLAVALLATLLVTAVGVIQFARAADDAIDRALKNGETVNFDDNKDGTTTWSTKHGDIVNTDKHGNEINTATASKADSASAARSDNNVKCFAFCLGISSAKSASAADSESRTNSPGNTARASPITQSDPPIQLTLPPIDRNNAITLPKHNHNYNNDDGGFAEGLTEGRAPIPGYGYTTHNDNQIFDPQSGIYVDKNKASAAAITFNQGTECIDNTGSPYDNGYSQGYVDGNRDSVGLNGHGFDDSLHGNHTPDYKNGYKNGYGAGYGDGKQGINKNPC